MIPIKLNYLDQAGRYQDALIVAEELAADTTRPAADRQAFAFQVARQLIMLDRVDDANVTYDRLVAAAGADRHEAYRVIRNKANLITHRRFEEGLRAFEAARALCDPGTQEWLNVEIPRLRLLRTRGRFDEALTGFDAVLALPQLDPIDRAVCLGDQALTLAKMGRRSEATRAADAADAAWPGLNPADQSTTIDFIRGMIEAARRDFGAVPARP